MRLLARAVRQVAVAVVLSSALAGAAAPAGGPGLALTDDLQAVGTLAREAGVPIVLMVSREYCPMCARLKREVLGPMALSGEYADRAIMREIKIDPGERVRDFDGRDVAAAELAERYHAFLTPTLLFLDGRGAELAPRILGVQNTDFFGHYVDQAIGLARDRLRSGSR